MLKKSKAEAFVIARKFPSVTDKYIHNMLTALSEINSLEKYTRIAKLVQLSSSQQKHDRFALSYLLKVLKNTFIFLHESVPYKYSKLD